MAVMITDLSNQPVRTITKEQQTYSKRIKLTQKQMGDISDKVDKTLKDRSKNICEVKERCNGAPAVQRAHTRGRRVIDHKTTVDDLLHACVACHNWMDQTPEGIRFSKKVRESGGSTKYLETRGSEMRGKKPTLKQKKTIAHYGLNLDSWLVAKSPPGQLHLIHRYTDQIKIIPA